MKKRIIVVENNPELVQVIEFNLKKAFDLDLVTYKNTDDLSKQDIDAIIARDHISNSAIVYEVVKFLKIKSSKIPFFVLGRETFHYEVEYLINPASSWKIFIENIAKVVGLTPAKDFMESKIGYQAVPLVYFMNIDQASIGCDIFIRIKKENDQFQYIKRFKSGDKFSNEEILKYKESGLLDFYIPREQYDNFVSYVTDKMLAQLQSESTEPIRKMQIASDIYEITRDRMNNLGVDEITVELVEENVKLMQKTVGEKNALNDFLAAMKKNLLSYSYAHSYLCCLLLNQIIKSFEWESASVREKISYICYFHDISLLEDRLIKICSSQELEAAKLSKDDHDKVLSHAMKSAEIVDKFSQVPIGVSSLIKEHHGVKSGVGFRNHLSINLSPLSMMFVVVEAFVDEYLKRGLPPAKEDIAEIFSKMDGTFNKVTYAQTLLALQAAILKK